MQKVKPVAVRCLSPMGVKAPTAKPKRVIQEAEPKPKLPHIIATDFDGCLCANRWPNIGPPNEIAINTLIGRQQQGCKIILWTCRRNEELSDALEWSNQQGLHYDAVNENLPEVIEQFGGDCRKIFAHEYWDDRACVVKYAGGL